MLKHILFVVILVGGGYYFWNTRPIIHGPGEVAPNQPFQQHSYGISPIKQENFIFTPVAKFDIEARILSKKHYHDDKEASFAPTDFVVGWGPMSDERNLDKILIKQSERSFYWEMIEPPVPIHEMRLNSANMRLIPSNKIMGDQLNNIRIGQIIRIKGYLVNVEAKDGWSAKSSLVRSDTGKEASEIVWVKELNIF